ncbi:hypothetical protein GCM10009753_51630 [Streptantibioticus ferralitis]
MVIKRTVTLGHKCADLLRIHVGLYRVMYEISDQQVRITRSDGVPPSGNRSCLRSSPALGCQQVEWHARAEACWMTSRQSTGGGLRNRDSGRELRLYQLDRLHHFRGRDRVVAEAVCTNGVIFSHAFNASTSLVGGRRSGMRPLACLEEDRVVRCRARSAAAFAPL